MNTNKNISCESDYDPNSLLIKYAYQEIFNTVETSAKVEIRPISDCLGRVLANDIGAPFNVPNHNNSAMDGYAICLSDLEELGKLKVVGKSFAGHPFQGTCNKGECIRIMTGAIVPENFDTILIQENVQVTDEYIQLIPEAQGKQKLGQHIRYAGESLKRNDVAIAAGTKLLPRHIGLIASLGIPNVSVMQKPKVAIITTGDEIKPLGSDIVEGEVFDSNRYTLMAMLQQLNCEVIDLGIIKDDEQVTKSTLLHASEVADIVIATGGASVGDADYVRHVFSELGDVSFWKLAMRPGRPLSFGKINNSVFFGLPGNPVSVMVTFYQFVTPAINHWLGIPTNPENITGYFNLRAKSLTNLRKRPGRTEYQRGLLIQDSDGQWQVQATGDQGSGILSSMTKANCFIVLDNDCQGVTSGELVTVEPFFGIE